MTSLFTKISRLSDDKKACVQEALDLLNEQNIKKYESTRCADEELTNQLSLLQKENERLREAEKQRSILLDDCKAALEYTYEEQYQKVIEIINTAFNRMKGIS